MLLDLLAWERNLSPALQGRGHSLMPSLSFADIGTEGQRSAGGANKGPVGVVNSCAHFLFTGPSIYPIIE